MKRCVGGVLLLGLALLPTLPAQADDRSLREAGRSRDAQFERLGDRTRRAYRAWERSGHKRRWARRVLRLNRSTRRELDIVEAAVKGEQPSSRYGRTYKRELLRSLRAFDAGLRWDSRAMRLHTRGRRAAALAAWRRANRHWARSRRHERRALRAIRRVVPD